VPDDAGVARPLRILPDAMVLAAGLTSRREPASFSRRLVEAALDGQVELVLTETLLEEALAVLVDSDFRGRLSDDVAEVLLGALRAVAVEVVDDTALVPPTRSSDPDDDYLVDAALATGSMLVSRDDRADFGSIPGLDIGRPGTALRRAGLLVD
jgi:predicted nucleic acid-binding protein